MTIESVLTIAFDAATQAIGPLQEAAYRLLGTGVCHISGTDAGFLCRLEPSGATAMSAAALRQHFLALVTDENLRTKVNSETAAIRNVILALAVGALAQEASSPPSQE